MNLHSIRIGDTVRLISREEIPVAGQMVHDLDLAADVLDVIPVDELAGGDGLAGELLLRLLVRDQVRHAELAAAELAAEDVGGADVLHRPAEDAAGGRGGGGGGRRVRGTGGPGGGGPDVEAVGVGGGGGGAAVGIGGARRAAVAGVGGREAVAVAHRWRESQRLVNEAEIERGGRVDSSEIMRHLLRRRLSEIFFFFWVVVEGCPN